MIDIKLIRQDSKVIEKAILNKKFHCNLQNFVKTDIARRALLAQKQSLRFSQRIANKELAILEKNSETFKKKIKKIKIISNKVKTLNNQFQILSKQWNELYLSIPNIPHNSVPIGSSKDNNQIINIWESNIPISVYAKAHYDIPNFNNIFDLYRGSKVTGKGFPFYINNLAKLSRALTNFFLDEAEIAGYIEVIPPFIVNEASATATGQLPDKEGQMYNLNQNNNYLIPTAEVPITNFYRDEIIKEAKLPIAYVAYSPCFRREAGSWGKDAKGLNRLHQFEKVELVRWTKPKFSFEELEVLRLHCESLLKKLELTYRTLLICTGDMGFANAKQYDLEVWSAGQNRWLEVSSCSNFTDFQARRANIRSLSKENNKHYFVHTINGSALAIPRIMAAIIENNLKSDNSVKLPPVLQNYFGNSTFRLDYD